jgi:clan AA aspartic protease
MGRFHSESMGLFRVRVRIFSLRDEHRAREIEMVVDTGATYSVIPRELAQDLGIPTTQERTFTLADGRQMTRHLGRAGFAYDGVEAAGVVVIGEPDDVPLLGANALEELGMEVDPVAKTLRPATLYRLVAKADSSS